MFVMVMVMVLEVLVRSDAVKCWAVSGSAGSGAGR